MASSHKYPPPEIWDQILSEVTYYPGEFDADDWVGGNELELARRDIMTNTPNNRFILYNKMQGDMETNFGLQLDTRRSLVLVCRQWYNLSIHHLYSSIIIQGIGIRKLANTITSNKSLGLLVKRLELKWANQNYVSDLVRILSNCPNLVIFYELPGGSGTTVMPWWNLLMNNPAICAKFRYAAGDPIRIPKTHFIPFISSLSSLVALKLTSFPLYIGHRLIPRIPIRLPKLRTLDLGNINTTQSFSYICGWNLPKLTTLWVSSETTGVSLEEFWRKHGKKLMTIKIYDPNPDTIVSNLAFAHGIDSIGEPPSEIFPCLRQLIVHNVIGGFTPLFLPSMSLEIHEVSLHRIKLSPYALVDLIERQLSADNVPNLRIFKVSGCPSESDGSPRKDFDKYREEYRNRTEAKLEARGIALEFVDIE